MYTFVNDKVILKQTVKSEYQVNSKYKTPSNYRETVLWPAGDRILIKQQAWC